MRILTWNVNSIRIRLPQFFEIIAKYQPDVFCLQETKTPDEFFPLNDLVMAGYPYYHFTGMKSYNGVAIFSKIPLSDKQIYNRYNKNDCRHISVKVDDKEKPFELHNIYIPAGGHEADPEVSDSFRHKLEFVDELTEWFSNERSADDAVIAVGDFNIAPLENDVWSHKQMLKVVSHTPVEVEKLTKFFNSIKFVDAVRHFYPASEKLFSWWSYRSANWDMADRGLRLDHIWVTKKLVAGLKQCQVPRDVRGMERPSDHIPVIVDL